MKGDHEQMKVIRNINNNVSLCLDSKGREVIVFGKGIGFIKPPYELPLHKIDRTFYNIKDTNFSGIKNIPISIINAAIKIKDEAEEHLNITLMSTAALSLADHIHFAIQRLENHILLEMPVQEDIKQLYPKEVKEATKALQIIKEETGFTLDRNEASMIALHFINNRIDQNTISNINGEKILEECVQIIEGEYAITIDQDSFNYSRFATHVDYLLKRMLKRDEIKSENKNLYNTLKKEYPSAFQCASKMRNVFKEHFDICLSEEEVLYLMLHINRLCTRVQQIE